MVILENIYINIDKLSIWQGCLLKILINILYIHILYDIHSCVSISNSLWSNNSQAPASKLQTSSKALILTCMSKKYEHHKSAKLPWWRISQFHQEIPFIKLAGPKSPGPTFEAEHLRADVASGWVLASPHSDTAFSSVSPSPPLDHHHDCQQFTNTLLYNQHLQIHQLSQFSPGAQTFYQKRITSAKMEPSRYKQYP